MALTLKKYCEEKGLEITLGKNAFGKSRRAY